MSLQPLHTVALPNLHRLTSEIYVGGTPRGSEGLQELAALGIHTVISVDGERPEAAAAEALGLRYVHLPIGYDGVSRERIVELLSAVHSLPKPIYIHCHRGLHRGPAAAMAMCRLTTGLDATQAVVLLEQLGTSHKYPGLYASVEHLAPVTPAELRQHPVHRLPSVALVPPLVEHMVAIEAQWEALSTPLRAATAWNAELTAALTILEEQFAEAGRLAAEAACREELADFASQIRKTLAVAPSAAAQRIQQGCVDCHQRHRDRPRS